MLLVFCSSLILFYGLKDRLNQYLQHKKLNLPYCVKSVSGPEAYIQGPDRRGETWRIMKSSVGQEMRFC
ncbi:hypothetical protein C1X10_25155 [Escherichia coli]|nr:hypothetical protein C1X10_25155 [Escherichia coli]